ncbi:MAG: putative peptidoglycan hydrolase [Prokaryotic dsDNA virus sp.]|nr:MAG: putative peptidoglycan hydrolase [Prokaryotic dsDNA virus sp.]|tara:strand:+ start:23945 stop:25078 length:1134 start_codon:yes stop_codon:yes gene_type:complete
MASAAQNMMSFFRDVTGESERDRQALGRIMSGQTIPEFARAGGAEPDTPENIRSAQLAQLAELGTPEALQALGRLSPLGQQDASLGATGELAKRVMQDNPGMTFSDALAQVQTGYRKGLMFGGGQATPIQGFGSALGELGGQESYGTKLGELSARLESEPDVARAVARAELEGSGKISEREQLARTQKEREKLSRRALISSKDATKNINKVIDKALNQADAWTTGFVGNIGSYVAGTPQFDLAANLKTIQADAAFDRLQEMRDNSKTGGALGQVSERELELLSAARAALEQSQSAEQFKENLTRYKQVRNQAFINTAKAYQEDYGKLPEGITVDDMEVARSATQGGYSSAEAVGEAFKAGRITQEQAVQELKKFGYE